MVYYLGLRSRSRDSSILRFFGRGRVEGEGGRRDYFYFIDERLRFL